MSEDPRAKPRRVMTRRTVLAGLAAGAVSCALPITDPSSPGVEEFLRQHFRRLTPEQLNAILKRTEAELSLKHGKQITVKATPSMDNVTFGYALDLSTCIGCRKCVYACVTENNLSRDPQIHWINVLEFDKDNPKWQILEDSNRYYDPAQVPEEGKFYVPVQCQQCKNPACVKVCPVQATWREPDGIVVVDYNWCIGCRFCMAACPYGARNFNWDTPHVPSEEINPEMHYLGNRPQHRGVVGKCTFCIQRTREGKYPACVEACPVGARKFGNLLDPKSEIRYVLENYGVLILKQELDTNPQFFYFFSTGTPVTS